MAFGMIIITAIIILDRAVKYWASISLKNIGSMPFIDNLLRLSYAENTGVAFSMFQEKRIFIIAVNLIILAAAVLVIKKRYIKHITGNIGLFMVIGGAIGNMIDRIFYGYVIDMFEFTFIKFAVFNVADSFVTCGGILLVIYVIFFSGKSDNKAHGANKNADS